MLKPEFSERMKKKKKLSDVWHNYIVIPILYLTRQDHYFQMNCQKKKDNNRNGNTQKEDQ